MIMSDSGSDLGKQSGYLIVGIILITAAVVSTRAGKTIARYQGWIYRDKEPSDFWWGVALYFLGGIICIGLNLHSFRP